MADIPIGGTLATNGSTFPIVKAEQVKGCTFAVADDTARDAIDSSIREVGMSVYVIADAKTYRLVGGITNGAWTEVIAGVQLNVANTFTKSQNVASVAIADSSTVDTDASLGNVFTVTLAGNRTLANPTNLVAGGTYMWIITQGSGGSHTLAYGALFTWPAGLAPVLSTTAAYVDLITAVYDGIKLRAVFTGDVR